MRKIAFLVCKNGAKFGSKSVKRACLRPFEAEFGLEEAVFAAGLHTKRPKKAFGM